MTDRAAYTLAAAILAAGALVAGAVSSPRVGRYTFRDEALLDSATGELLTPNEEARDGQGRATWESYAGPVGTPPAAGSK